MATKGDFRFDESNACRSCLLPRPFATLNEEGVCQHCLHYKPLVLGGVDALRAALTGGDPQARYDTMVAISGGRDSMYALYFAKKVLGLNVLAYNYNNEFVHEQAFANMEQACKALGVDFVSVASKNDICHKIVSDQVRLAAHHGPGALEIHLCSACNVGGFLAAKKIAQEKRISSIILGNSDEEKVPDTLKVGRRIPLKKKIFSTAVPYFLRGQINKLRQRLEFSSSLKDILNLRFSPKNEDPEAIRIHGIRVIPIYNFIKWDRREIVHTIEGELGWRKPGDRTSTWRFDCRLIGLVNYLWTKACGYPKAFFGHVQMIRSGTMTKEEALKQLRATDWAAFTQEMEEVLKNDLHVRQKHIDTIKSYSSS